MASYSPDIIYIASIYPGQLEPLRRNYGPSRESFGKNASRSTLFQLQPVPRGGKPFLLKCMDSFEDVIDVVGTGATQQGVKPRLTKPVDVQTIVSDILNCWTGGIHTAPGKPGIIQIAGTVPTEFEMNEMMTQQTEYFEFMFAEGERHNEQHNIKEITGVMRLAAEWLGHSRSWSNRAIAQNSNPCPLCTAMIPDAAIVCPVCRGQIKALPSNMVFDRPQPAAR